MSKAAASSFIHCQRRRAATGLLAAALLHVGVFGLFALSIERARPQPVLEEPGPAISVGLTSASALANARLPVDELAREFRQDQVAEESAKSTPKSDAASLLAQMDVVQPSGSSTPTHPAHAAVSANPSQSGPKLADAANPWTHAALSAVDGTKARPLWLAAERCWHGGVSFTPSEIRIVLDNAGAVTSMAWVNGGDAGARAQAEAVAAAINACAPYRAVATGAGTYLVVGPLA